MSNKIETLKDSEMQRILDIVIKAECYTPYDNLSGREDDPDDWDDIWSNYMCSSLIIACKRELISQDDRLNAQKTIMDWLYNSGAGKGYLWKTLKFFGLPYDYEHCLNIYTNWAMRPFNNTEEN